MFIQTNMLLEYAGKPFKPYKHITIKSGHGVGKTALEAWLVIWFMLTRPFCRVPCTAPTQHQLYDILWTEISKWIKEIKFHMYVDRLEWTATHIYNKRNPHDWFAVARSASKPENLQGFHAKELLFNIEEASGVAQEIMEVVQGALTNEGAWCFMMGNPTQLAGTFFDSFHKERKYWKCFTFSCIDSSIVSDEYVERMKGKYGEDSPVYAVRVLGEFPEVAIDTLIPMPWAEAAAIRELEEDKEEDICIGVDVARFGDDKTIILVRQGNKVLEMQEFVKQGTMETTGRVMLILKKYEKWNRKVFVDDTGVGGGVTDRLDELNMGDAAVYIEGVNNGSKANDVDTFYNRGTELWWYMREHIREWDIPQDDELIAQLCTRKYRIESDKRIRIEPKKEMKERISGKGEAIAKAGASPDKADALALAFAEEDGVIIDDGR